MADRWFYARGEEKRGPYSGQQLKELAASGELVLTDTVWKEGVERGSPAARVRHLFVAPQVASKVSAAEPPPLDPAPTPPATSAPPPGDLVNPPASPSPQPRRGTAVAVSGAVIVGQDGASVKYKKVCKACGNADSSWHTAPILNGPIKSIFYCRKCRKTRQVELKGALS